MKNTLTFRRALALFSLTVGGNSQVYGLAPESFFTPFNELFEAMELQAQPTKNRETAEKDLHARVASLQEEAKRLSKAADELASTLDKKGLNEPAALTAIDDSHAAINNTLRGIKRELQAVQRARRFEIAKQTPAHSLRTQSDDTKSLFIVTAILPDIAKEDLKITVKTSDEFGTERQTLQITADTKAIKSVTSGLFSSSTTTQARYINGRREELTTENGNITIVVDLPKDASNDLAEVQKTMTFENSTLVLSFPMAKKAHKKETELRFTGSQKNLPPSENTTRTALK